MDLNPPAGSKISIGEDNGDPTIVIPAAGGFSRYFIGAVPAVLARHVADRISRRGLESSLAGNAPAFLIFWLCAWTLGGIAAAYTLFRILRPSVPETLTLRRNSLAYDSGVAPTAVQFLQAQPESDQRLALRAFPERVRAEIERKRLQTLRLRETESGNRLTLDLDATRVDLASTASEVEREWLAKILARRYSLPQLLGNAANDP